MRQIEDLVETESVGDSVSNPLKRRLDEPDSDRSVKVKTERSMSRESNSSQATRSSSMPVKMEIDQTNAVDEETSNAASILNGVSKDRRTVHSIQLTILMSDEHTTISNASLSFLLATGKSKNTQLNLMVQDEKGPLSQSYHDPPSAPWIYASQQASFN
jgi:hypothetical protein